MGNEQVTSIVETFSSQLINRLSAIKDEIEFFINNGYLDYAQNMKNKFSYTNTFLYIKEKVDFYEVYFPLQISYNERNKEKYNWDGDNIDKLFEISNYIGVIGRAGSGKSMITKHLFLQALKSNQIIPIYIELRSVNINEYDGSIVDYIKKKVLNNFPIPNDRILNRLFSYGAFLFILDGYDEINSKFKRKLAEDLDSFIDKYPKNRFFMTSRPGVNMEIFPRFICFSTKTLTMDQVISFVNIQLKHDNILASRIIEEISKPQNGVYTNYLSNPLLLSMFILTYNSHPSIPKKKSTFYWNVFDTLSTKHDSITKQGGFMHERKTSKHLDIDDINKILQWFSYLALLEGYCFFDNSYIHEKFELIKEILNIQFNNIDLIDDLNVATGILITEGIYYRFPHRSIQEYFAVLLVCKQNTDNKISFYTNRLPIYETKYGNLSNLFELFIELDNLFFLKYYVQNILKDFYATVKSSNESETINNYLKQFFSKISVNINALDKKKAFIQEIGFRYPRISILNSFLDFGNSRVLIYNLEEKAIQSNITTKSFENIMPNNKILVFTQNKSNLIITELLQKTDGILYVTKYLNKVKTEIERIDKMLSKEENSITSFF